jgi:hypothetical protein
MVLKNKLNGIYNLVIATLISLLMLMLYLGNYNLIEGNNNNTTAQVVNNLDSLLEKNKSGLSVLKNNKPYNSVCSSIDNMNKENLNFITEIGGAQTSEAQTVHKANQLKATLCSNNGQL